MRLYLPLNFIRRFLFGMVPLCSAMVLSMNAHAGSLSCDFSLSAQWSSGANAVVQLTNNGDEPADWEEVTLSFSDAGDAQVSNAWNAEWDGATPASFEPYGWNRTLAPGQSAEIGMQLATPSAGDFPEAQLGGDCDADNQAPVAVMTMQVMESLVTLDARDSHDPDGDTLTYEWTVNGSVYATEPFLDNHGFENGDYVISVTVSDGELSDVATETLSIIYPQTQDPIAAFDQTPDGMTVSFDASESRAMGGPGTRLDLYEWDFGDGSTGTGIDPVHTYEEAGVYEVTLTVYDDNLDSGTKTRSVAVPNTGNSPPVAVLELDHFESLLSMDGRESYDPDGDTLTYEWELNGRLLPDTVPYMGTYYVGRGEHTVSLTVSDGELSDTVTDTTNINYPPAPFAELEYELDGATVSFDGSASFAPALDAEIYSYSWQFGDGNTADGVAPVHTYAVPGSYDVTLVVHDTNMVSDSATVPITIEGPAVANVECLYEVTNSWGNNFSGTIRVINNGDEVIDGWSVDWSYGDASSLTHWWGADISGTDTYTATGFDWNSAIEPGNAIQFGFQGVSGSAEVSIPQLTGATCAH